MGWKRTTSPARKRCNLKWYHTLDCTRYLSQSLIALVRCALFLRELSDDPHSFPSPLRYFDKTHFAKLESARTMRFHLTSAFELSTRFVSRLERPSKCGSKQNVSCKLIRITYRTFFLVDWFRVCLWNDVVSSKNVAVRLFSSIAARFWLRIFSSKIWVYRWRWHQTMKLESTNFRLDSLFLLKVNLMQKKTPCISCCPSSRGMRKGHEGDSSIFHLIENERSD